MKKQIINVFIAAAVLSALIGCGGGQVQNTSADHSAVTSTAAGAAEKEKEGSSVQAGGTQTPKETASTKSNAAQDPKQSAESVTSAQPATEQQGAEQQGAEQQAAEEPVEEEVKEKMLKMMIGDTEVSAGIEVEILCRALQRPAQDLTVDADRSERIGIDISRDNIPDADRAVKSADLIAETGGGEIGSGRGKLYLVEKIRDKGTVYRHVEMIIRHQGSVQGADRQIEPVRNLSMHLCKVGGHTGFRPISGGEQIALCTDASVALYRHVHANVTACLIRRLAGPGLPDVSGRKRHVLVTGEENIEIQFLTQPPGLILRCIREGALRVLSGRPQRHR